MVRKKDSSKRMTRLLFVLFVISILMMTFVFIAPIPTLASEETPPPQTDYYPLGCICFEGPWVYRCCSNYAYYPETGRYLCLGHWYLSNTTMGCDYWPSYP